MFYVYAQILRWIDTDWEINIALKFVARCLASINNTEFSGFVVGGMHNDFLWESSLFHMKLHDGVMEV